MPSNTCSFVDGLWDVTHTDATNFCDYDQRKKAWRCQFCIVAKDSLMDTGHQFLFIV